MLRKTIGSLALGLALGSGGVIMLERAGFFDDTEKPLSSEYLKQKQREILQLMNKNYSSYTQTPRQNCSLFLTGQSKRKILITLICGDYLIMPHVETSQYSRGNFSTRIDGIDIENGQFGRGDCITIENEDGAGTTCKKKEEEYSPVSRRG